MVRPKKATAAPSTKQRREPQGASAAASAPSHKKSKSTAAKSSRENNNNNNNNNNNAADAGDFLVRLLRSLPDRLIAHPLSDRHPVSRLLVEPKPKRSSGASAGATSSKAAAAPSTTTTASSQQQEEDEEHNHPATYWLVLATHVLQQLLPLTTGGSGGSKADSTSKKSKAPSKKAAAKQQSTSTSPPQLPNEADCHAVAGLCHAVARALPRHKLDGTVATRHLVGRALLVVSVAAAQTLSVVCSAVEEEEETTTSDLVGSSDDDNDDENNEDSTNNNNNKQQQRARAAAAAACIVALDRVTLAVQPHAASATVSAEDAYWSSLQISEALTTDCFWEEHPDDDDSSSAAALSNQDWSAAEACFKALTDVVDTTDNNNNNSNSNNNDKVLEAFRTLLQDQSTTFSEGRHALKRWSAVALTWYNNGQDRLMEAARQLLERRDAWTLEPDKCTALVPVQAATTQDKKKAEAAASYGSNNNTKKPSKKEKAAAAKAAAARQQQQQQQSTVAVTVPPNVVQLALVGRLCRIVCETTQAAGSRPPTGELDAFLRRVAGVVPKSSSGGSKASSNQNKKSLVRADLRHVSMVVAYQFIQQHRACLRENCDSQETTNGSSGCRMINDDAADQIRTQGVVSNNEQKNNRPSSLSWLKSLYLYYPFVHKAMEELAGAAASGHGSSILQQQQIRDRIEYAAAAYVVQAQAQQNAAARQRQVVDAKLTNFAVSKLVSCLSSGSGVSSGSGSGSNNPTADSVPSMVPAASDWSSPKRKKHENNKAVVVNHQPLPVPALPSSVTTKPAPSRKRKAASTTAAAVSVCSFAGVYHCDGNKGGDSGGEWTVDDKFQLFVRAMEDASGNPSQLVSHLLWILEACYDTRDDNDCGGGAVIVENSSSSSSSADGKKRKPASTAATRSSKRRKKATTGGRGKKKAEEAVAAEEVSERPYKPIAGMRASVAVRALDALRLFLRDPLLDSSLTSVQATLRPTVTLEQMCQIVALGPVLYEVIVQSRLRALEALARSDESKSPRSVLDDTDAGCFTEEEQNLWIKHKDLLVTLGRGRDTYLDEITAARLGDLRLPLFKKIAELSKRQSPKGWPLQLNPINRLFLASSLTSEPLVGASEIVGREAEIYIVDGFVTELELALKDLSPLEKPGNFSAADGIAVSWADARIFLAAFARLSSEEQSSSFMSLLLPVDRCFSQLIGKQTSENIADNSEIASFLARLVTLCVHAYIMMCFGTGAREELFRAVGKYIPDQLPMLIVPEDWFTAENAFLGVFNDWQDSELPSIPVPSNIAAKHGGEPMLQRLLESAFALGFVTAKTDRCHLLYAAWNALGKNDLWNMHVNQSRVQPLTKLPKNLSTILLQLRDDVANVHRLALRASDLFHPSTTLLKAIDQMETAGVKHSQQSLRAEVAIQLRLMIKKASKLVELLQEQYIPADASMNQEIPPEVFCILEAAAAYISFAVSSYTKPKFDFFTTLISAMTERAVRHRDRGYSSDSADNHSEGGSEESNDALVDTMERMQDVCDCFGAAPAHPDWLDKECRLLDGVSFGEAAEAALEAQSCLTKLLSFGLTRSRLSHQRAVQKLLGEGEENVAALASDLWWLGQMFPNESGVSAYNSGERRYIIDVGEICGLDAEASSIVLADSSAGPRSSADECWQGHSAQRILGRYQEIFRNSLAGNVETAELRASREWEVLLSGALTAACVYVKPDADLVVDEDVCNELTQSGRWFGISGSAIDAMVPSVALLRFGLSSGGRIAHPLSSADMSIMTFESNKAAVIEDVPPGIVASKSTRDAIVLTLGVLAMHPPHATCDAIATHLMIDPAKFESVRGMEASSVALQALAGLQDVLEAKDEGSEASPLVVERIADVLESCGTVRHNDGHRTPTYILGCLREGGLPFVSLDCFGSRETTDPSLALDRAYCLASNSSRWEPPRERYLQCLMSPFFKEFVGASARSLSFFADALSSMIVMECKKSSADSSTLLQLLSPLAATLNELPDKKLSETIRTYICKKTTEETADDHHCCVQESMSTIIAFLLLSSFSKVDHVLSLLQDSYDEWKAFPIQQRKRIMELALLFACRSNKLFQIGKLLIGDLKEHLKSRPEDIHNAFENVKHFTDFLLAVKAALSKKSSTPPSSSPLPSKALLSSLPEKCSYEIISDFHDQHWYNCYTCGLTADKGCCSLCAVVCHQGHDVEYARNSSFFCDCGGDEIPENRMKCKCLAANSRDKFLKNHRVAEAGKATAKGHQGTNDSLVLSEALCAEIVNSAFSHEGREAIDELFEKGQKAGWALFLFDCTKQTFEGWRSHRDASAGIFAADSYGALRSALCLRKQVGTVKKLHTAEMISLGVSCSGSFQTKMSIDSATDRAKRSRLSDGGIVRSVMDADSRGRLVVSEPRGLFFCNGLPIANSLCSSPSAPDQPFTRSSMRVISSVDVGLQTVGLKFAQDNERMVLVWGLDESKVVLMNEHLTSAVSTVVLDCSARKAESDIIVNAHWLHGSGTCAVLGFRRSLLFFDVSKVDEKAVSRSGIAISTDCFGCVLRDFAIAPRAKNGVDQNGTVCCWDVYVLMDNGIVYTTCVRQETSGKLSSDEFDSMKRLPPPTQEHHPNASTAAQKGIGLTYLDQSSILLYQGSSSGVIAYLLDESGGTQGHFNLLPFDLSAEPSTEGSETLTVKGPYTHWKQLGSVCRESTKAFRVSCCAQSSSAGEPVLLCLEFDENETRVQEFARRSTGWFDAPETCEGAAAFSAPVLYDDSGPGLYSEKSFVERVFLCTLTKNGCLHIHTETVSSPARTALEPAQDLAVAVGEQPAGNNIPKDSVFDVLEFEKLKNVTVSNDLIYSADGLGSSDSIREKLSLVNADSFLVSSSCDGFTLNVSCKGRDALQSTKMGETREDLVISAVRILVGTYSTDNIPKSLRVNGRIVTLKAGQKRWYSVHLSAQEVALSIRSGFVTIGVDQCFDSSSTPVLDAMELYGIERKMIEHWLPMNLRQCAASLSVARSASKNDVAPKNYDQNAFRLCLTTLTNLLALLGNFKPSKAEETFLKQLVQDTSLENDPEIDCGVCSLVASFKPNEDFRQSFVDTAMLSGCAIFLNNCQEQLDACERDKTSAQALRVWHSLTPSLRTCLQTAARIAKLRPFNYLQVSEEAPKSFESIAADACQLAHGWLAKSLANESLVFDLVEISLLEIAITNGRKRGRFGGLRSLLSSPSTVVVGQTCTAISLFCRECDIFSTLTKAVQYVCDSCLVYINDTRYTSMDDAQPFDLCPNCYRLGNEYISDEMPTDATSVIINGKTVGDEQKLTCGEVKNMQAVAIRKKPASDTGGTTEKPTGVAQAEPESAQQQLFNDFMDVLITGIFGLLGEWLTRPDFVPDKMVWLSTEFVRHSFQSGRKLDKAKRLTEAMAIGLSRRLASASQQEGAAAQCVLFLEGLTSLVLPNQSAVDFLLGVNPISVPEDTPPPSAAGVICDVHKAPTKMQRFIDGVDNGRTFLVCSVEKKAKCNFFAWADESSLRNEAQITSLFIDEIAKLVWQLLNRKLGNSEVPLNLLLAAFIQRFSNETVKGDTNEDSGIHNLLRSAGHAFDRNFADGVFCSHGRLKSDSYEGRLVSLNQQFGSVESGRKSGVCVVEKSLVLMALTASPEHDKKHTEWFPILCQLMLQDKFQGLSSGSLPILAKESLRRLCGGLWRQVRDFYAFTFKFEKLVESGKDVLRHAVLLNEKARQCGPSWRTSTLKGFETLRIGDFAGTEELMSEDATTLQLNNSLSKLLGDLWASASKRGGSWKRFCGLRSVKTESVSATISSHDPLDFSVASPLMVLFCLADSVSTENQVKILRLIHLGLTHTTDRNPLGAKPVEKSKSYSSDDEDVDTSLGCELFGFIGAQGASALDIVSASTDDLHPWVLRFVYRGTNSEIRSLSCKVSIRLCHSLQKRDLGLLVNRLMRDPVAQCGTFGKRSSDFLSFLQSLVKLAGPSTIEVGSLAAQIQSHFKQQILALRHDRMNGEYMYLENKANNQKKRIDLACCVSCCLHMSRVKDKSAEKVAASTSSGSAPHGSSRGISSSSTSKTKWIPGQVSPFVRGRLHASRDSFTSNEFNVFYSLKNRCAISEIHVEVENPRRHVKTIKFYFSPRPVKDPSILKSDAFADNWQPCGTLNLSRGSSRSTLTISSPVIAANLKIEYADFYDVGTSRSSDGSLVVMCPRCTRAVTNAHGVCSNCGEVAFQCRKCRHINYDRLDAFLCVECGYCASATFQFELTAAVATNSVAITNDAEYEKTTKMAAVASRLHKDLKAALRLKLSSLVRSKKKIGTIGEAESVRGQQGFDSIRRAFEASSAGDFGNSDDALDFSKLSVSQLGKSGSIVKIVARPDARGESSLYRLARRSERSTRSENTIQGLRMEDEATSELIGGLLDGSGGLSRFAGIDAGDPLSQLLASVQSRRERREVEEREQQQAASGGGDGGSKKPAQQSAKEAMDLVDRLFELMREAEREAYKLERRCIAWRRLNSGRLAETGSEPQQLIFEPSHCPNCSPQVAHQMLWLWLRLFEMNPDAVTIDQEMISLLLNDIPNVHYKNLHDAKNAAVKDIAIRSRQGRPLVLDALRARLNFTQDVNSAEILGNILEAVGGDEAAPFVALATEALEAAP